jgi:hypothetical protein
MPFTDHPLDVRQASETRWVLLCPVVYFGREDRFEVPAGFDTDFASVPRVFWWLVPRYGRYTKASVLHDHLCELARLGQFGRRDADGIFRRSMREEQVNFLRRWVMWAAVRLGCGLSDTTLGEALLVLLVALLVLPLVLPGALVVLVSLFLFFVAEYVVYAVRKLWPAKLHTAGAPPKVLLRRRRYGPPEGRGGDGEAS